MNNDNETLINDDMDERIESFLRGIMSAEEETVFKQELKSNPELRKRAMTMASLVKETHATEAVSEEKAISSVKKDHKPKVRFVLWWASSVAAVFVIFFGLHIYNDRRYNMLDATISPYYTEYDVADISRGETDSVAVAHLYSLFNEISQQRNVSDIIKELESIYNSIVTEYTYYPFANDIIWNLALAYTKDDQIEKAIVLLEKLKNENPDTPLSVKAVDLLNKLKELQ